MVTDFIEDFMETDNFRFHLDDMFGEGSPPLAWDQRREYTRDRVQLYYQVSCLWHGLSRADRSNHRDFLVTLL